jgi:hypothetical protein
MKIEDTRRDMQTLSLSIQQGKEKDVVVQEALTRRHEVYSSDLQKQIKESEERRHADLAKEQREVEAMRDIELQFKKLLEQETKKLYAEFDEEFTK